MERVTQVGRVSLMSAEQVASSRLGVGFEKLDRDVFDPEKAYDRVAALGVKKVRLQSGWARTERERGVYDFSWLDRIVEELTSRHLEPWLCLCYGNPLYTPLAVPVFGAVGCPPINSPEATEAWLAYVRATVTHFRGRISLYEIWNEPDCGYSWRHCEDEVRDVVQNAWEYGVFARETAKAVKEADASAQTVGFALGNIGDMSYLNRALATGLYQVLDYVSFHCYSVDDGRRVERIRGLRALLDSYDPHIGIIQGESGAQSRSDGAGAMHGFAWTPQRQRTQLLRLILTDLYEGVAFTSYFSTMDMVEALRGRLADKASYMDFGYFGVLSATFDENGRATGSYEPKPSYQALAVLASLFAGDVKAARVPFMREVLPSRLVDGRDCSDATVRTLPFRLAGGQLALVYWNGVPLLTTEYEGTVSFTVYGEDNENIRLVDLADGSLYALAPEAVEDVRDGGVLLKNIPITHSPLAVIFGKLS